MPTKPLLTLHTQDTEAASAMMPVSWCTEPELAASLLSQGVRDPRLLLVVQYQAGNVFAGHTDAYWRDESYSIHKLDTGFAYVTFHRPGPHRVIAVPVDVSTKDRRRGLQALTIRGSVGQPTMAGAGYQIVRHHRGGDPDTLDGRPYVSENGFYLFGEIKFSQVLATTDIDIDAALFAESLSPRRIWISNRVFGTTKFRDECQARNRTLIWGPIFLPFILLFASLFKLVSVPVFTILGFRRPYYRALLNPTGKFFNDYLNDPRFDYSSIWWHKQKTNKHGDRFTDWRFPEPLNIVSCILSPPVLALLPLPIFGIMNARHHVTRHGVVTHPKLNTMPLWQAYLWVDGSLAALLIVLATLIMTAVGITAFVALVRNDPNWRQKLKIARPRDYQAEVQRAVQLAACPDGDARTSISDLHLSQLTPRLIFSAAKAAVCKPFAQS